MITKRNRIPEHFYCDSGSSERDLFVLVNDHLEPAGVEDTQALIDSYKDSCDLKLIIDRVNQGEYDLLIKKRGIFIDTTQFPTNVIEAQNMARQTRALYDSLDPEIKKEIGSFDKFSKWKDSDYTEFIERHRVVPEVNVDPVVNSESEVK